MILAPIDDHLANLYLCIVIQAALKTTSKKLQVMKLKNILLVLAATTIGFASCSSENDILEEVNTPAIGGEEMVNVSFTISNNNTTKSAGTTDSKPANQYESTINNCIIAIFDNRDGLMLAKREFTPGNGLVEGEQNEDGSRTYSVSSIQTKSVASTIIIIANYATNDFQNAISIEEFETMLTASIEKTNLMKSCKIENYKPTSGCNIPVALKQCAARIDLNLNFRAPNNTTATIENIQVKISDVNTRTHTFPTGSNAVMDGEQNNLPACLFEGNIQARGTEAETATNFINVASFYTYSTPANTQFTLTLTGDIIEKGQTIKTISHTISIKGGESGNGQLQSGVLYKINGTVVYEGQRISVTFASNVEEWINAGDIAVDMAGDN